MAKKKAPKKPPAKDPTPNFERFAKKDTAKKKKPGKK